jgi:trans-2,3-dihydro-3-hydroxyanthranilate isomerase
VTQHYRYYVADVFTSIPYAGNPLAVIPDARGLTTEAMAKIAREFNLSETVFVLPARDHRHTRSLRIFTPAKELPFAGHPTIGTAIVLATGGYVSTAIEDGDVEIVLEEGIGPVPVCIRMTDGMPDFATLTAKHPQLVAGTPPGRAAAAAMLSLAPEDIVAGARAIETWSCGVPYLFIPAVNREAVGRARPVGDLGGHALFVFAHAGSDIYARMFAPELGVVEDPATGSAAAALGGYLAARDARQDGTLSWAITQGVEMGRPSLLDLEVDRSGGQVTAVRVGGKAVVVSEGSIRAM